MALFGTAADAGRQPVHVHRLHCTMRRSHSIGAPTSDGGVAGNAPRPTPTRPPTTAAAEPLEPTTGSRRVPWIGSFNIDYFLGVDGISMPLVLLTTFLSFLAMIASWKIDKYVKGYCILFLLLETGMLGTFLALDFFLFYIFWEVMLLPMYFLIGVWGGPRREYAAIKFFLYTLLGSVFILIAMLVLLLHRRPRLRRPADATQQADRAARRRAPGRPTTGRTTAARQSTPST